MGPIEHQRRDDTGLPEAATKVVVRQWPCGTAATSWCSTSSWPTRSVPVW
jgi:hypothetical protein